MIHGNSPYQVSPEENISTKREKAAEIQGVEFCADEKQYYASLDLLCHSSNFHFVHFEGKEENDTKAGIDFLLLLFLMVLFFL